MALIPGKQIRDGSISGAKLQSDAVAWKDPVAVKHLVGNATATTINGLTPSQGDAYVVTAAGTLTLGSLSVAIGDLVEYSGSIWVKIIANSGGFVPSGTRAILSTQTALIAPYTDTSDDGKIVTFSGSSNTGTDTGDAVDGYSVAVNGDGGVYEHSILVFSGSVATGVWEGGGDIVAGTGLSKTVNTVNVGDVNKGVQANADDLQVDASEIASSTGGLQQVSGAGNEHLLEVKLDTTTGGGVPGLALSANGINIGTAAAGAGLTGGGGSALAVQATNGVEVSGDNVQLDLLAAGGLKLTGTEVGVEPNDFAGSGLEDDGSDNLRIASSAAGNGLTGGSGSALSVDPDSETGTPIAPVNVTANGVGLDIDAIAGTGLEEDGAANLRLATQGNGIAGGNGSVLSVDPDSESGGNIEPVTVGANGVGVDINSIAGTGLEADGSANLRLATQGNGIAGGAGSTLSVDPDSESGGNIEPVTVGANGVGVDINSIAGSGLEADGSANLRIAAAAAGTGLTGGGGSALAIDETGATVSVTAGTWTFTKDTLQVTGVPDSANDSVNKAYVDSVASGLRWVAPVLVRGLVGNAAETTIEGLSPSAGDAYVVSSVDGDGTLNPGGVASLAVGDVVEYDGSSWVRIQAGSGGFVAACRMILSEQTTLIAPYTDGSDNDEIHEFDGTSLTGTDTTETADGAAVFVSGDGGYYENLGFVYDGVSPSGTWNQFTGTGQLTGGAGLSISGNTLNVGDASKGIQVNADDLEFAAAEAVEAGGGLKAGTNSWELAIEPNDFAGTGLEDDGSDNLRIAAAAAGDGLTGGGGSALSIDLDTTTGGGEPGLVVGANGLGVGANLAGNGLSLTQGSAMAVDPDSETGGNTQPVSVGANGVGLDVSAIAGTGLEADGSANLRIAAAAAGNGLTGGAGSALAVQADGTSVSVGASGVKAAVPTSGDKEQQSAATSGDGSSTGVTIAATPAGDGMVTVLLNGVQVTLGNGVKTKDCYFSADAGSTARNIADIASGDTLYWNGVVVGFDLDTNDYLDFNYNVIV